MRRFLEQYSLDLLGVCLGTREGTTRRDGQFPGGKAAGKQLRKRQNKRDK